MGSASVGPSPGFPAGTKSSKRRRGGRQSRNQG